MEKVILLCIFKTYRAENGSSCRKFFQNIFLTADSADFIPIFVIV